MKRIAKVLVVLVPFLTVLALSVTLTACGDDSGDTDLLTKDMTVTLTPHDLLAPSNDEGTDL